MRYYQFNIGDYQAHTAHLDEIEDLAYRRMLDWLYLHEKPLPLDAQEVGRLIRMRTHSERIADVMLEFFERTPKGFIHRRVDLEIEGFHSKKEKARRSAKARWDKENQAPESRELKDVCERNANHKPITSNKNKRKNKQKEKLSFANWPQEPNPEQWSAILEIRRKKKATNSQRALDLLGKQLHRAIEAGHTFQHCMDTWENRQWSGFTAEWLDKPGNNNATRHQTAADRRADIAQAINDNAARAAQGLGRDAFQETDSDLRQSVVEPIPFPGGPGVRHVGMVASARGSKS